MFDATANMRVYRNAGRDRIARFVEVFVDTPLEVCAARDPKGLYRAAATGEALNLPGAQAAYEPPLHAEVTVSGCKGAAGDAAGAIVAFLDARCWL